MVKRALISVGASVNVDDVVAEPLSHHTVAELAMTITTPDLMEETII